MFRPDRSDAGIDNVHIDLTVACKNVDRCSATQEIQNHLPCYFAGISTDILLTHTVAPGVNTDPFLPETWRHRTLQSSDAYREFFKDSERTGRLRFPIHQLERTRASFRGAFRYPSTAGNIGANHWKFRDFAQVSIFKFFSHSVHSSFCDEAFSRPPNGAQ